MTDFALYDRHGFSDEQLNREVQKLAEELASLNDWGKVEIEKSSKASERSDDAIVHYFDIFALSQDTSSSQEDSGAEEPPKRFPIAAKSDD